jgi:Putative peptidoglycan binding domain
MTTPDDILWGKYKQYSGPYYLGTRKFKLPANPSESHKLLAVTTRTEGGRFNAINAYDRCIISTGLLQWCEAKYFLTSKLLGAIASTDPSLLDPLAPALAASNAEFKEKTSGRWRFFFKDSRGEVDAGTEQKQLFLLDSPGHQGSWDDASKAHAKLWAASMANVLVQDVAVEVQTKYTASRMRSFFIVSKARPVIYDGTASTGWTGAMRAIFTSFAANLPAVAAKMLAAHLAATTDPKWSKDWCVGLTKQLTFGPGIAIYPHRYNAIRPVVEQLYGVDLPDLADELKAWQGGMGLGNVDPEVILDETSEVPTFTTAKEIQQLFHDLGYDLGPAGVDGWMGRKTKETVITFQGNFGLVTDGIVGPKTRARMQDIWRAKVGH